MRTSQRRGWNQAKVVAAKPVGSICSRDKVTWCYLCNKRPWKPKSGNISSSPCTCVLTECFTDLTLAPSFRGLCSQCLLPLLDQGPPKTHSGWKTETREAMPNCANTFQIFISIRSGLLVFCQLKHITSQTPHQKGRELLVPTGRL